MNYTPTESPNIDKLANTQPLPFHVTSTYYLQHLAAAEGPVHGNQFRKLAFGCEWGDCRVDCKTKETLILHLALHVKERMYACRWRGCWNMKNDFASETRLTEHLRAHTLQRPYGCPAKSCKARFSIIANFYAHGRTRHNRILKPVVFDAGGSVMTMDEETDDLELEIVSIRMDEEPIHKDSRKRKQAAPTEEMYRKLTRSSKEEPSKMEETIQSFEIFSDIMENFKNWTEYCRTEMIRIQKHFQQIAELLDKGEDRLSEFERKCEKLESHLNNTDIDIGATCAMVEKNGVEIS